MCGIIDGYPSHNLCRNPTNHAAIWHAPSHHRIGTNYRTTTYAYTFQDNAPLSEPHAILYDHR